MTKYPKESKVRVRLWSGQMVNGIVLKKRLFMYLVEYQIEVLHVDLESYMTTDTKWYPIWRIYS